MPPSCGNVAEELLQDASIGQRAVAVALCPGIGLSGESNPGNWTSTDLYMVVPDLVVDGEQLRLFVLPKT